VIRTITLCAVAALGLSAGAHAADPIKIGASLPLTGNFSVSGEKHEKGYQLCVDLINEKGGLLGRELDLIISDNRSDIGTALSQYERFINVDDVDLVFGTFSSKLTFPISAVLAKNGMVHPIPAGGALRIYTQGHDNIFYFQQNAAEYIGSSVEGVLKNLVDEGERPSKAALVHADDFFANAIAAGLLGQKVTDPGGGEVADLSPGYLADAGMEVVYTEKWPEEGFSDWLNLANSIKNSGADLVVGLTASAEEAVQLTRALKTVRANPKMLYLSQGTQAEYLEGVGADAAQGTLVHTSWHEAVPFVGQLAGEDFSNQDFQKAFEAKYGNKPDEDSAIPFAVCQGMEQAVIGANSTDNAKMGEWLYARTKEDPARTVLGPFSWNDVGLPVDRPFLIAQWQDGQLKFVYPTDEFEGVSDLVHPKPEW